MNLQFRIQMESIKVNITITKYMQFSFTNNIKSMKDHIKISYQTNHFNKNISYTISDGPSSI